MTRLATSPRLALVAAGAIALGALAAPAAGAQSVSSSSLAAEPLTSSEQAPLVVDWVRCTITGFSTGALNLCVVPPVLGSLTSGTGAS